MAISGKTGAEIEPVAREPIAAFFGEDQARYVIAVPSADAEHVLTAAQSQAITAVRIGTTGGRDLKIGSEAISIAQLRSAHESWFPAYMGGEEIPPTN